MDAVKNSCHVLLQGGNGCVHVLTRTTVVFQNINEPLPVFFLQCIEYILIRIVDLFKLRVIFDNQVNNALMNLMYWASRSTTTDFTAALSRFVKCSLIVFVNLFSRIATMS